MSQCLAVLTQFEKHHRHHYFLQTPPHFELGTNWLSIFLLFEKSCKWTTFDPRILAHEAHHALPESAKFRSPGKRKQIHVGFFGACSREKSLGKVAKWSNQRCNWVPSI
uniref:Uncharacterized protein n=1 Tax=Physcomitrium patens TaxID=3218 RepID=A0A2K1JYU4_PHYPA|nr:hypothetical protein PHYPA_013821 [Physcomitrium patens]